MLPNVRHERRRKGREAARSGPWHVRSMEWLGGMRRCWLGRLSVVRKDDAPKICRDPRNNAEQDRTIRIRCSCGLQRQDAALLAANRFRRYENLGDGIHFNNEDTVTQVSVAALNVAVSRPLKNQ